MSTQHNKRETIEIIRTSSVPDLLILRDNYEKLERYKSTTRNRYFLNLVKRQLQEKGE